MKIKKLTDNAIIPTHGTPGSAGYDLYATEAAEFKPGDTRLIGTGIAMEIPAGYYGGLFSRSGLATKDGLSVATGTSVIDSDYRGEVKVPLRNNSNTYRYISVGDRIAQIVISPYSNEYIEVVDELSDTTRGEGGFGSTNK